MSSPPMWKPCNVKFVCGIYTGNTVLNENINAEIADQ